jgi:hypothetical protein
MFVVGRQAIAGVGRKAMTGEIDYPEVRAGVCPLCRKDEDMGLLVCWACYRADGLRAGNLEVEQGIVTFAGRLRWMLGGQANGGK